MPAHLSSSGQPLPDITWALGVPVDIFEAIEGQLVLCGFRGARIGRGVGADGNMCIWISNCDQIACACVAALEPWIF